MHGLMHFSSTLTTLVPIYCLMHGNGKNTTMFWPKNLIAYRAHFFFFFFNLETLTHLLV